jgi:hypothetical protein
VLGYSSATMADVCDEDPSCHQDMQILEYFLIMLFLQ